MKLLSKSQEHKNRRFADQMIAALRQEGEKRPIRYDVHENRLWIGNKQDESMYLVNAYIAYCAAHPTERQAVLRNYASFNYQAAAEIITTSRLDEVRTHLMPRIKDRATFATWADDDLGNPKKPFWHRPIADHLAVSLAYDLPTSIVEVPDQLLLDWGIAGEEAFDIACENLRQRSKKPFHSPAPGVFMSAWKDDYGSSRVVLPALIRELEVKGDYVALVPERDTLIITGSEDRAGLGTMLDLAKQAFDRPYRVSGVAIRLNQGQWEPFNPDICHPGLEGFRSLRLASLQSAYGAQQEALPLKVMEKGEDGFVASYKLRSRNDGSSPFSCAVWTKGISILLPITEKVVLVQNLNPFQVAAYADWERVREVVGDLMTPIDIYPQRFRVDRFPTEEQLKELGFVERFDARAQGLD